MLLSAGRRMKLTGAGARGVRVQSGQAGFTLIEMLVASTLFLIVMTVMLALFDSQGKVARETNQRADILANARYAMDVVTKDLRSAGANLAEATVSKFINGDFPDGTTGIGDGIVTASDDPTLYPDYIEMKTAPGGGSPCVFNLADTMVPGAIQSANLKVPSPSGDGSDLADYMEDNCAGSYGPPGCMNLWIVENDTGSLYTIIDVSQYNSTSDEALLVHPPGQSDFNFPGGLPGTPSTDASLFNGGRVRLANDYKIIAYRISGQTTTSPYPTLQRGEANACSAAMTWTTVAENVEDLQFAFAYLDSTGDDDNVNGTLERSGGVSPFYRYPTSSYTDATTVAPADAPHRIRYIRVSMIVRAELAALKRWVGPGGSLAITGTPVFYNRPTLEDRLGSAAVDARARVFLQEVVEVRNRNLPGL